MLNNKKFLASGTFGMVYKIPFNEGSVCQKIFLEPENKYGISQDILREIFHFSSPYSQISILHLSPNFSDFTMDLFDGDLFLTKKDKVVVDKKDMLEIRSQILKQLYEIHSHGFLHSDIKIANILFHKQKNVFVLCDFGLSEFYGFPSIKKEYICTDYFKAPENGIKNNINYDIYSLGATLYYLNESKYNPKIDKKMIFSPIVTDLLNNDHTVSAKSLIKTLKSDDEWMTVSNDCIFELIRALHVKDDGTMKQSTDINDSIFLDLSVKNNRYHAYGFGEPPLFELEYLDDMFLTYYNKQIAFNQTNNIEIKIKQLQTHKNIKTHLETLLFAWYLIDNVPLTNLLDKIIEGLLFFNYSCKILEFNTLNKIVIPKYVNEVEFNITSHILSKKISFTPAVFYLYYFLYKLSSKYPSYYYLEYRILEGIALPLLLLYLIMPKPIICSDLTYARLSFEILLCAIDFVRHKKISNQEFINCIRPILQMFPSTLKQYLIENNELLTYLSAC